MASSSSRSSASNVDVRAAQAAHRGLRRRQRRTQVVADRGEQRGAHPVGLGERPGGGGLLGEAFLRSATAAWAANASTMRRSAASSRRPLSTTVSRSSTGTAVSPALGLHARPVADAGHHPPGALVAGAVGSPLGVGGQFQHADRAQPEGLPQPVQQGRQRPFTAQDAAGDGGQGLRVGGGAGGLPGPPGGHVDHPADRDRDADEDAEGEQVFRLGDGQRVEGRGEEPVQQQRADERGDQRRPHPADQRDADDAGEEEQDVVGQGEVGQRRQQQGEQRHAAARRARSRAAGVAGTVPPAPRRRAGPARPRGG